MYSLFHKLSQQQSFPKLMLVAVVVCLYLATFFFPEAYQSILISYFSILDSLIARMTEGGFAHDVLKVAPVDDNFLYLKPLMLLFISLVIVYRYPFRDAVLWLLLFGVYVCVVHVVRIYLLSVSIGTEYLQANFDHRAFYRMALLLYFPVLSKSNRQKIIYAENEADRIGTYLFRGYQFLLLTYGVLLVVSFFADPRILDSIAGLTLFLTSNVLNIMQFDVFVEAHNLYGQFTKIHVGDPCVGIKIMFVFCFIVFMGNGGLFAKVAFSLGGIVLLIFTNVVRIALLFVYVYENGNIVDSMWNHHSIYNWVIYLCVVILWLIWFRKNTPAKKKITYSFGISQSSSPNIK